MTYLLLLFLLKLCIVSTFDPSTVNYCEDKCPGAAGVEHTACKCVHEPPRKIDEENLADFRKLIVDVHNELRNKVASGGEAETNEFIKGASNMRVMNYDLELEYIAKCLAFKFKENHDRCRDKHKGNMAGQNLAGSSRNREDIRSLLMSWYDEFKEVNSDDAIDNYGGGLPIGHFTQMVWAEADLVGCSRVWNPKTPTQAFYYTLICNYASTTGPGGNLIGTPVYMKGDACSACPGDLKCETEKYSALCGKLLAVPTAAIGAPAAGIASQASISPFVLIIAPFIYIVFY